MKNRNIINVTRISITTDRGIMVMYEASDKDGNSIIFIYGKDIIMPVRIGNIWDFGCITLGDVKIKDTNVPLITAIILSGDFYENVDFNNVKEYIMNNYNVYSVEAFGKLLMAIFKSLNIPTWTDDGSDLLEKYKIVRNTNIKI